MPPDWPHLYTGFLAHFNKNSNLSWAFDTWFLNLFPRQSPFLFNNGGWSTLSFIPTLATMMLGLWAGEWLKTRARRAKARGLVVAGVALTLGGLVLQWLHLCPIVKRIWTSSYTLYSGGLILLILAGFYAVDRDPGLEALVVLADGDRRELDRDLRDELDARALRLGSLQDPPRLGAVPVFGPPFEPVLRGAAVLLVFWGILVLDVSAEDLHPNLNRASPSPGCGLVRQPASIPLPPEILPCERSYFPKAHRLPLNQPSLRSSLCMRPSCPPVRSCTSVAISTIPACTTWVSSITPASSTVKRSQLRRRCRRQQFAISFVAGTHCSRMDGCSWLVGPNRGLGRRRALQTTARTAYSVVRRKPMSSTQRVHSGCPWRAWSQSASRPPEVGGGIQHW